LTFIQVTAIAARSPDAAQAFAERHSIPKIYSSYSELIHSPDIDVVYIGTIADHHVQWTKEALLAGKPVVCEKPMALSSVEVEELVDLAKERNVFLM
jgi:dihydrodiol dehydrogenase / D-xylose 1-dehydrogenase (NADP)